MKLPYIQKMVETPKYNGLYCPSPLRPGESIVDFISNVKPSMLELCRSWNKKESDKMKDKQVDFISNVKPSMLELCRSWNKKESDKMKDKQFVLTGSFELGKKYWEEKIKAKGGKIGSGVSKKTSYLIQQYGKSDGSPSIKEMTALEHNVPIISVEELEMMLGEGEER